MEDGEAVVLKEMYYISVYCYNVLVLLQSVAVKAPKVAAAPYICAQRSAQGNGSGNDHPIILPHSLPCPPPLKRTTWGSQES